VRELRHSKKKLLLTIFKNFWRKFRGKTNAYRLYQCFGEEFLEICTNICLKKLLAVTKESENIQPGYAELKKKGRLKHATVQICCAWCLSTRINVSRDMTHSKSTRTLGE
jgi:hypothetical protein